MGFKSGDWAGDSHFFVNKVIAVLAAKCNPIVTKPLTHWQKGSYFYLNI